MWHWMWQSRDSHWFVCSNWCLLLNNVQSRGNMGVNIVERQYHQPSSRNAPLSGFVDSVYRYNVHLYTLYIICMENNSLCSMKIFVFFSECFKLLLILSYIVAVYYNLQVMINTQLHTSMGSAFSMLYSTGLEIHRVWNTCSEICS